ncbi:MAG: hypothetical protein IPF64_17495 [Flavobacteriales bacterium]|nr:hypothetical protein [Flavobacteriales bacterium]
MTTALVFRVGAVAQASGAARRADDHRAMLPASSLPVPEAHGCRHGVAQRHSCPLRWRNVPGRSIRVRRPMLELLQRELRSD